MAFPCTESKASKDIESNCDVTKKAVEGVGKVTRMGATMELVITQLGTGILLLPYAFSEAGIVASIAVILIVGVAADSRAALLAKCFDLSTEKQTAASLSFTAVAREALGSAGAVAVSVSLSATLFACSLAYLILCGTLLSELLPWQGVSPFASKVLWKALVSLFLWVTSSLDGFSEMQWIGTVGSLATVVTAAVVVIVAVRSMDMEDRGHASFAPPSASALLGSITTFCYSYGAIQTLPTIAQDMKERSKDLAAAVHYSHAFCTSVYLLIGLVAFIGFGNAVEPNVLESVRKNGISLWRVAVTGIVFHLVMAIPILMNVVFRSVQERLPAKPCVRTLWRSISVFVLFTLSCTPLDIFADFVGIVPATTVTLNCFVWPAVIYWGLMRRAHGSIRCAAKKAPGSFTLDVLIALSALIAMVLGTKAGIESLISDLNKQGI